MTLASFGKPGRFLRGNLHTHSTRSDGKLAPEEVSRRYRAMGYDFYALTDHFLARYDWPITDTTGHRAPGFTTLIGAELHAGRTSQGDIWHILAVGLPFDFAPAAEESGPELARRAIDAGAFVAIAHPQWYGLTEADGRALSFVHAIEIYNHNCLIDADRAEGVDEPDADWVREVGLGSAQPSFLGLYPKQEHLSPRRRASGLCRAVEFALQYGEILAHRFLGRAGAEVERAGGGGRGQHMLPRARWCGCLEADAPLARRHRAAHHVVDHPVIGVQVDLQHAATGTLQGGGKRRAGGDLAIGHRQADRLARPFAPHRITEDHDRRTQAGIERIGGDLEAIAAGARMVQKAFQRQVLPRRAGDADHAGVVL